MSKILCKIRIHTNIRFYRHDLPAGVSREPAIWDRAHCCDCGRSFSETKKEMRRRRELESDIKRVKGEINRYGKPLITGIILP